MVTVMQNMNVEIEAAVNFFACLLVKAQFSVECTKTFSTVLSVLLKQHYKGHWYPSEPMKGSGYRCLRVNGVMHPILVEAVNNCKLQMRKVRSAFPTELTVWVDPNNVGVRFGEEGSIGLLYSTGNSNNLTNAADASKESERVLWDSTNDQQGRKKMSVISPTTNPRTANRFWSKEWKPNNETSDENEIDDDGRCNRSNYFNAFVDC